MVRDFFLKTKRIGFSEWKQDDIDLAEQLWGDLEVTRFICASGQFSANDIAIRLSKEIDNNAKHHVQYWPIFELNSNELIGCCGLRPYNEGKYELGFHLRSKFWGQGYAVESANAVIDYAFKVLRAKGLFAGHNPNNVASQKVLAKLGFSYIGDEFYEPTGLYHSSYELNQRALSINVHHLIEGAKKAEGLTVIIDVFRAFSLECYLYDMGVKEIRPVGAIEEAFELKRALPNSVLVGERKGKMCEGFDFGNSPSSISKEQVAGKTIIHTTSAGTQGIVNAKGADEIITGSLVNAKAVAEYIMEKQPEVVSLVCMGNGGVRPAAEDEL